MRIALFLFLPVMIRTLNNNRPLFMQPHDSVLFTYICKNITNGYTSTTSKMGVLTLMRNQNFEACLVLISVVTNGQVSKSQSSCLQDANVSRSGGAATAPSTLRIRCPLEVFQKECFFDQPIFLQQPDFVSLCSFVSGIQLCCVWTRLRVPLFLCRFLLLRQKSFTLCTTICSKETTKKLVFFFVCYRFKERYKLHPSDLEKM